MSELPFCFSSECCQFDLMQLSVSPQSDVVHQSVFELIHTDDRAMFREQLHFALNPPPVASDADCKW